MKANVRSISGCKAHFTALGVLLVLLIPGSFESVAAKVGFEMHVVSFLIGPALYTFGDQLVPGVDFFTQYSVGQPWLFSHVVAPTAAGTVTRYAVWIVVGMFFFYTSMFYFLWWLYRNWQLALAVTLIVLISLFHTERPFFDPSSFPLRYPLLFVWLGLAVRSSQLKAPVAWWIVLGSVVGLSLFLNTETAIYMLLATGLVCMVSEKSFFRGSVNCAVTVTTAGLIFMLLCLGAFGTGILDFRFLKHIFEPFFIYGEGFGAWPLYWAFDWHLLYNIISPGLALATIGWAVAEVKLERHAVERTRVIALLAASCVAIMMSVKYWNMSIAGLWVASSFLFWTILGWWAFQFLHLISETRIAIGGRCISAFSVAKWTMIVGVIAFVVLMDDTRNRSLYGLKAYAKYPSFLRQVLSRSKPICADMKCAVPSISSTDIALITSLTEPRQRVAIYSPIDWAYLIEARRAPHFEFLPSHATFTRRQVRAATTGFDLIFLPKSAADDLGIDQPELAEVLIPKLKRDFEIAAVGTDLVAWQRKSTRKYP